MKIFGFEISYVGFGTRNHKTSSVEKMKNKPPKPGDDNYYGKLPNGGTRVKLTDTEPPLPPPVQSGTRIEYTDRQLPKPAPQTVFYKCPYANENIIDNLKGKVISSKELVDIPISSKLFTVPVLSINILNESLIENYIKLKPDDYYIDKLYIKYVEYINENNELVILNANHNILHTEVGFTFSYDEHKIELIGCVKDNEVCITSMNSTKITRVGFGGIIKIK